MKQETKIYCNIKHKNYVICPTFLLNFLCPLLYNIVFTYLSKIKSAWWPYSSSPAKSEPQFTYLIKQMNTCSHTDISCVPAGECAAASSTRTIQGWDHVLHALACSCSLWADITTERIQAHKQTTVITNFKIITSYTHLVKPTITTYIAWCSYCSAAATSGQRSPLPSVTNWIWICKLPILNTNFKIRTSSTYLVMWSSCSHYRVSTVDLHSIVFHLQSPMKL